MKKVLKWVLIPIALIAAIPLLLLVLLLLCFPICYRVFAKIDEGKDVRVKVSYLFGLVRFMYSSKNGDEDVILWILFLRLRSKAVQKSKIKRERKTSGIFSFVLKSFEKEAIDKEADSKKILTNLKDILTFDEIKTIIKDSFKTIKKLLAAVRPKFIDIEGEFGRTDPADTAFLYGGYEAAAHILGIRKNVRLLPVFNNEAEVMRLRLDVRGRINIYSLIVPVARLLLTNPIRDLILKGDSNE